MPNRLSTSNSPYLLQHAANPVDWYPWGDEALQKARDEDKPIFLSIGYAACHWCHVMAHESFEDPQTASLMNEYFVNIKVDREERPDIDSIYMSAVTSITGQGGWPLSVFLDAQGRPFYGGTYFPPQRRYNLMGFAELVQTIGRLWREDRQELLNSAEKITRHLQSQQPVGWLDTPLQRSTLDEAARALGAAYDWQNGGWGGAPKFPQPMAIEFLLRRAWRAQIAGSEAHDDTAHRPVQHEALSVESKIALHALHAMRRGGMYDVVGGGFARYSTDERWLVPHFEKMLYDNAQLARVYLHGYLLSGDPALRRVCEETLDFIAREMCAPCDPTSEIAGGGFFSSLDADSEGEEGKYYLWTLAEIRQALNPPASSQSAVPVSSKAPTAPTQGETLTFPAGLDAFAFFSAAYGLSAPPNFEGHYVLQRVLDNGQLAKQFDLERLALCADDVPDLLATLHRQLLAARDLRVRPATDDKVLTCWNALALVAFAEAARYLKRPDYLEIARRNADFLLTELNPQDRLLRSWRAGNAQHDAYLEDHAALILGLLALYQSDPDLYWFNSAQTLAGEMLAHFSDPNGGFFDTRADGAALLLRPKDIQDNATPSGSALAVQALLELSAFSGDGEMREHAESALRSITPYLSRYPTAFAKWLSALDYALYPPQEIAILGDPEDSRTQELADAVWSHYRPQAVLAVSAYPPPSGAPALLQARQLVDGLPTAYVCQNFTCQRPVTDPDALQAQLSGE